MGRRTKGDGGLFQRADGMWIGRVELPPVDGIRRRRQVSSRDFDTAAAELRKLRRDVDEGRIAVTGNTTVEKWLERWITEIHPNSPRRPRPTTIRDYRTSIRLHINPHIGKKRLDKLTPTDIRKMQSAIGARRAAEKAHVILQKALKDAIREQMITRNVAELVYKPTYTRGKRQSMSADLAKRVIATAFTSRDKSEATRWAAAFLTGARQGELLGLTWECIDLDAGVMNITWQLQQLSRIHGCGNPTEVDGKPVYPCGKKRPGFCPQARWDLPADFEYRECHKSLLWTRPKTQAGDRWVPIIAPLLAQLAELHDRQGHNPHDLVWHYPDGRPIGPREDYEAWRSLLIDAQVIAPEGQTLPMHVARHTTATLLRAAGVDEQTRMEILGHATVDSQRIYAHADRARHLAAMGNLAELISIEKSQTPHTART
ncbi:tyrosine-type recombinase/integrase [Mycobacterium colombiense]